MPTRVGLVSVRSRMRAPARRLASSKDDSRLAVRSHPVRAENIRGRCYPTRPVDFCDGRP